MIIYTPNKAFGLDILHLGRSWTMRKLMYYTLGVGVVTALLVAPIIHLEISEELKMNPTVFSFLGIVLSILLVFRTNSAYDRWWEGRKQWGALVNNTRNLAILVQTAFPKDDEQVRHFMATRISNFCLALAEHLRNGVILEELINLNDEDRHAYEQKDHLPNYIATEIQQKFHDAYQAEVIGPEDHRNTMQVWRSFLDIPGACERIKKTPIPFSYAVHIRTFTLTYTVLLPFALVATFQFWTVPLVMFIFYAFMGVQMMAEEIEDPFGTNCNDLPTSTIAHTIKNNVFEILEDKHHVKTESNQRDYDKIH